MFIDIFYFMCKIRIASEVTVTSVNTIHIYCYCIHSIVLSLLEKISCNFSTCSSFPVPLLKYDGISVCRDIR